MKKTHLPGKEAGDSCVVRRSGRRARATQHMPVQCFADDASLPPSLREAHALIRELQFPANCSSQRILEWPGIRIALTGIGSAMHDVTVAMAVAWASGRTLVMSMRSPPKTRGISKRAKIRRHQTFTNAWAWRP